MKLKIDASKVNVSRFPASSTEPGELEVTGALEIEIEIEGEALADAIMTSLRHDVEIAIENESELTGAVPGIELDAITITACEFRDGAFHLTCDIDDWWPDSSQEGDDYDEDEDLDG